MQLLRLLASLALITTCLPMSDAFGHHSPSGFDLTKQISVTGTVTKVVWGNPHVYVFVAAEAEAGHTVEWQIECFAPNVLRRSGWDKQTLRIGDVLSVTGNPAKSDTRKEIFPSSIARGGAILFSMQNVMKIYGPDATPRSDVAANGLSGIWATAADMQALTRVMSHAPSTLTKEGADALQRFDQRTSPTVSCISSSAPMPMMFPDYKRVSVSGDAMTIEAEFDNMRRTIHLNVTTHDGAIPSLQGHSIGRWEGKTLVIDTARFSYHGTGNGGGLPSSTQKHLVERLSPHPDGKGLTYSFEATDPVYLTTPMQGSVQWLFAPTATFEAEPCTLENARRFIDQTKTAP